MQVTRIAIAGTGMPDVIQTVAAIQASGGQSIELLGFLDEQRARSRQISDFGRVLMAQPKQGRENIQFHHAKYRAAARHLRKDG